MQIPQRLRGLKWLTILVAVYAAVWIALEGNLWRVTLLGMGLTAVALGHLVQRWLAGRWLSVGQWVMGTAVFGLLLGFGSAGLTLMLMAIKTGLHNHGPEFTLEEISWMLQQLPVWSAVGLLGGAGVGLLLLAAARSR